MTQALLVGTDCSECSHRAVDHAARWAKVVNLRLYVVHVIQWSPFSFSTLQENEERHMRREAELDRAHSQILDPIVADLRSKGLDAEGVVRHGHPAETLSALATELDATNIIIGRKGQSRIKTKLFGKQKNMILSMMDRITADIGDKPITLAIVHAKEVTSVENLKGVFESSFNCRKIYSARFGPSLGINTGPETYAVMYIKHTA